MRKHGWQLPYHPLQVVANFDSFFCTSFYFLFCCCFVYSFWKIFVKVVAVAVFLALGFAFYVFFAPFVGKKMYQYIVTGLYSQLVTHLQISLFFIFIYVYVQTHLLLSKLVCGRSEICDMFFFLCFQIHAFDFFCESEFCFQFMIPSQFSLYNVPDKGIWLFVLIS